MILIRRDVGCNRLRKGEMLPDIQFSDLNDLKEKLKVAEETFHKVSFKDFGLKIKMKSENEGTVINGCVIGWVKSDEIYRKLKLPDSVI